MKLLEKPLVRPVIGAVVAAAALLSVPASANPDTHKFHSDFAVVSTRQGPQLERYAISVETRHGSIDIAPHGTPLPEWARKIKHEKVDQKTQVLMIARNFAEQRGVTGQGRFEHEVRPDGNSFTTEWPERLAEEDIGSFGTHYVIRVPVLGATDAKTGLGPIRVARPHGDAKAKTGLGPITIDHLAGDADLKTGQGPISVEFSEGHAGHATVKSGLGSLTVRGAKWADARTSQGSISVSLAQRPTDDISLKTALGSITLDMPEGTDAIVTASTAMGSISIDGVDANRGRSAGAMQRLQTILGDGGIAITCETHQGSITVDG